MQSCQCVTIFIIIILLSDVCVKSLFTNFTIFYPWPPRPNNHFAHAIVFAVKTKKNGFFNAAW